MTIGVDDQVIHQWKRGQIASGAARPVVLERNQAKPLGDAPRPTPAVPSIYEWQRQQAQRP
jgi:hypothetical protein